MSSANDIIEYVERLVSKDVVFFPPGLDAYWNRTHGHHDLTSTKDDGKVDDKSPLHFQLPNLLRVLYPIKSFAIRIMDWWRPWRCQSQSPLLQLPITVRAQIYLYVFTDLTTWARCDDDSLDANIFTTHNTQDPHATALALRDVCKQTRSKTANYPLVRAVLRSSTVQALHYYALTHPQIMKSIQHVYVRVQHYQNLGFELVISTSLKKKWNADRLKSVVEQKIPPEEPRGKNENIPGWCYPPTPPPTPVPEKEM